MAVEKKDIAFPEVPHGGVIELVFRDHQGNELFTDREKTTYADIWQIRRDEWQETVDKYEANFTNFANAWHYLDGHPAFWHFRYGPAEANHKPLEERLHVRHLEANYGINKCVTFLVGDEEHGTYVQIELGKHSWPVEYDSKKPETWDAVFRDWRLDCGGPTMEAAVLRAAHNVWEAYGNDRRVCDGPFNEMAYVTVVDSDYFDKLMEEHGDDGEINERVRRASQRLRRLLEEAESEM